MIDVIKANEISDIDISPMALYDIYTPIICVAGVGEQTDKFLIQLYTKSYLEEKGYHIILVSSRNKRLFCIIILLRKSNKRKNQKLLLWEFRKELCL